MSKFKVGDVVVYTGTARPGWVGSTGEVVRVNPFSIRVDFQDVGIRICSASSLTLKEEIVADKSSKNGKWIIWNPASPKPPKVRFDRKCDAEEVAKAMAQKYGEEFIVCRLQTSVKSVQSIKVKAL